MDTTRNLARASLTALLFIGAWGASSRAMGEDSKAPGPQGILMKDAYAVGSYCHEKVPAISESSLAGDHPALSAEEKIDSDRKSTRLNSSHLGISYAVSCL